MLDTFFFWKEDYALFWQMDIPIHQNQEKKYVGCTAKKKVMIWKKKVMLRFWNW